MEHEDIMSIMREKYDHDIQLFKEKRMKVLSSLSSLLLLSLEGMYSSAKVREGGGVRRVITFSSDGDLW